MRFAILRNGVVNNIVEAGEDFCLLLLSSGQADAYIQSDTAQMGMTWDGEVFSPAPPPPPVRKLSRLAFLNRFTAEERIAVRTAAKVNPAVEDYLALLELAEEVDLDFPQTVGGVQQLEQAELIGPGRAAEILA